MKKTPGYLLHSGKNKKLPYYLRQGLRYVMPRSWTQKYRAGLLKRESRLFDEGYIADRVNYYCKLAAPRPLPDESPSLGQFHRKGHPSTYFFDSFEFVRWYPNQLRWQYLFGDITIIPPAPAVVKSRPIEGENSNSVLLNLDKVRHFTFLKDRIPFRKKWDRAIFRGSVKGNPHRTRFIDLYRENPRVDVADTVCGTANNGQEGDRRNLQPQISLYEHLKYKFILALEGNDVASNLKWIMSSNSLAVMPRPTYETWFMEGRLIPGYHYVEIKPDFSDLEEKMDYYIHHPEEAEAIIRQANAYVSQFRHPRRERYISLRVLERYFTMTGQNPE